MLYLTIMNWVQRIGTSGATELHAKKINLNWNVRIACQVQRVLFKLHAMS
jgi:hypothetical protein